MARWVTSWAAVPQRAEPDDLAPLPFAGFRDTTVRQTVRLSAGGTRCRLRLSNAYGDRPLPVAATTVAFAPRAGAADLDSPACRVTFTGRPAVVVPAGSQVVSDPVDLPVPPGTDLAVSLHLAEPIAHDGVTCHSGSRTTSHLAPGDQTRAATLRRATPVEHWYFVSAVEVAATHRTAAAVMLGDSLTDGRGATTDGNDRWPDRLHDRLRRDPATAHVAVVNQGAGGNRVLNDGKGRNVLARFDRDVLALTGVAWLVVFAGINDIGTACACDVAQKAVAEELIAAYDQLVTRAHGHGILVVGATLTPLGGNEPYDDPAGLREGTRQAVNGWIRGGRRFDAVVDFDAAVRDPAGPRRLAGFADGGDHLHLTPAGYQALADAVPSHLFA
jgi:lysophospholipase L1-like esterase